MILSLKKFRALLAVGALFVAACGSDDAEPSGASADTQAPADADVSGHGDGSDFCDFVERTQDTDELLESITGDPAELEEAMTELRSRVEALADVAPGEIGDDVKLFTDGILKLVDALDAADYDFLDADLAFLEDEQLAQSISAATERIDEYSGDRCGIELGVSGDEPSTSDQDDEDVGGDDASGDDFSLEGGTIREQLLEQFVGFGFTQDEANCLVEQIDVSNVDVLAGDPAEVLAMFEDCDIPLTKLAELGG